FTGRAVNELRIISPTVYLPESLSQMGPVAVLSEEENIKSWSSLFKNIKRQTIGGYEANSKQKAALKRSFKHGFGYVIWEVSAPKTDGRAHGRLNGLATDSGSGREKVGRSAAGPAPRSL